MGGGGGGLAGAATAASFSTAGAGGEDDEASSARTESLLALELPGLLYKKLTEVCRDWAAVPAPVREAVNTKLEAAEAILAAMFQNQRA